MRPADCLVIVDGQHLSPSVSGSLFYNSFLADKFYILTFNFMLCFYEGALSRLSRLERRLRACVVQNVVGSSPGLYP